ncbi:MAG: c-type cytochrome biogenesis protein CcmI [Hyphomicrobium zavarzinii]|uniref:c-type cytochrome biogenesis protein CcmI n=1 Tax=Hyphomicrobium zavarzinii TaxID=48292 RepID=UPI001A456190|nr:c-type cytochrome biogenesis protein CcmI [Hyphomicrobium zavarzinii]MBL8844449.1 c-type cytochrome biogenesis protein CcmI [Hyphomicrobium zavarzinii]
MLLWVCFAILTASVVALLLRPLRQTQVAVVEPAAADLAVYRDQLRELDAERDRGLVVDSEIESARAEVARRLIKRASGEASETAESADDTASVNRARRIYVAITALLPVVGIGLYLLSGSPHLPDHPFSERQTAAGTGGDGASSIVNLIAQVEQRLRDHPEDGRGWDVIAPIYLRLGRYADAAHAFAEANRLEGETVRRLLGFAEATLLAENGIVTEPVRKAALRVLELDPARIEVRVWLTLAKEQDGDLAGAAAEYRDILDKAPADATWRSAVSERLDLVNRKLKGEKIPEEAPAAQAAPSAPPAAASGEMPDVSAMSPADRDAFVLSMVNRLADRLKDNGKDLEGWIRLARAYKVLGRESDALASLASARENFAGDRASLDEIDKSEQNLGLQGKKPESPQ